MKREEIPLPQFIISYEAIITFQELLYCFEWPGSPSMCDWMTVKVCIFYDEIPSYSNKLFINL